MPNKPRKPSETGISISLRKELLARADVRAKSLGWTRSQYLRTLLQNDLLRPGILAVQPAPSKIIYPDSGFTAKSELVAENPPPKQKKRKRKSGSG